METSTASTSLELLAQFAAKVIRAEFPELASKKTIRTAVLDWRSKQLETLGGDS